MNRRSYRPYSAANGSRRRLQSDNVCLIPASQLPFKEQREQIAADLPAEVFLVVPGTDSPITSVARALVPALLARGRHVTAVPTARVR